jgi:hypothetical protein
MDSIPQKQCKKCLEYKPLTLEYFKFNKRYNHFDHQCRVCVNQRDTDWRRTKGIVPKNKPLPDGTKGCPVCKRILPLADFYFLKSGKYSPQCSDCKAAYSKEYYHRDIETSRKRGKEQSAKHFHKNALYRKQHYPEQRKRTDEWVSKNRDRVNAGINKRRALKAMLPYDLPLGKEFEIISRFDGRCAICGRAESKGRRIVLDHWIAIKAKVVNNPGTVESNLVPICHGITGCNNSKSNQLPLNWLKKKFGDEGELIYDRIEKYLKAVRCGSSFERIE